MKARFLTILTTVVGLTLVAVITDQLIMPAITAHDHDVIVPDLQNFTRQEAAKRLESLGLEAHSKQRFSKSKEPGLVIQQIPEAGTHVKSGRAVQLMIATNQVLVTVPSVLLTTFRDAKFTLESQGLEVGELDTIPSHEYPEGIVVEQDVEAGSRVNVGAKIRMKISRGHDLLESKVPYVVHRSLVEAKAMIADAGLRLGTITKAFSSELLPGTVLEQSMDSARSVAPLTPLDLVVSEANQSDE
ncbi:MAG: PASTA domain-containing protein [Bacteroidetes bacterium]|nr:PASTA domain-containing protein [Bacteroidota bacterium]